MLEKVQIEKVLFLDIETAPQVSSFSEWDEKTKQLFALKNKMKFQAISHDALFKDLTESEIWDEVFKQTGGIQAEFGRIVCISVGIIKDSITGRQLRIKSFYHDNEDVILRQFANMLVEHFSSPYHILCGHNAKEFDIPYICRRMLINGVQLPNILNIAGKKPWEINHLDTMELWKFGDFKAYTSLSLLCHVFGISTPKDDISGADVARVYYENDKDTYDSGLERIKTYCEKDVIALVQLFLRFKGNNLIEEGNIYNAIF